MNDNKDLYDKWADCIFAKAKVERQRDELLKVLTDILAVANVRINDPRCGAFDAARAAIAKATRGAK